MAGYILSSNIEEMEFEYDQIELERAVQVALPGCSICLNDIKKGETAYQQNCEHVFHEDCINSWFHKGKSSCPNCRKNIRRDSNTYSGGSEQNTMFDISFNQTSALSDLVNAIDIYYSNLDLEEYPRLWNPRLWNNEEFSAESSADDDLFPVEIFEENS